MTDEKERDRQLTNAKSTFLQKREEMEQGTHQRHTRRTIPLGETQIRDTESHSVLEK